MPPRLITRPLGPWLEPVTPDRRSARFKAAWTDTQALLAREAEHLGAELVVVQIDVTEADLRRDGMIRTNARIDFPGVRVSFGSRHGPLAYATDAYDARYYGDMPGWQANVRAVALSLEALRAVDRHGVSKRGEQYVGWQALTATANGRMTREQAADLLAGGLDGFTAVRLLADRDQVQIAHRILTRRHHPDRGGDADLFARINVARDVLLAAP
jgi:hypothetical protein